MLAFTYHSAISDKVYYILDDFAVILYEGNATLTNKIIRQAAKKKGVKLPPSERWNWYENSNDKKTDKIFDRFFEKSELKVIGLETLSDEMHITKFTGIESNIQIYINKIKINRKLVTNFVYDKKPPYKLNKRELLKELNNMLRSNKKAGQELDNKPAGILTAKEFVKILRLAK